MPEDVSGHQGVHLHPVRHRPVRAAAHAEEASLRVGVALGSLLSAGEDDVAMRGESPGLKHKKARGGLQQGGHKGVEAGTFEWATRYSSIYLSLYAKTMSRCEVSRPDSSTKRPVAGCSREGTRGSGLTDSSI